MFPRVTFNFFMMDRKDRSKFNKMFSEFVRDQSIEDWMGWVISPSYSTPWVLKRLSWIVYKGVVTRLPQSSDLGISFRHWHIAVARLTLELLASGSVSVTGSTELNDLVSRAYLIWQPLLVKVYSNRWKIEVWQSHLYWCSCLPFCLLYSCQYHD